MSDTRKSFHGAEPLQEIVKGFRSRTLSTAKLATGLGVVALRFVQGLVRRLPGRPPLNDGPSARTVGR